MNPDVLQIHAAQTVWQAKINTFLERYPTQNPTHSHSSFSFVISRQRWPWQAGSKNDSGTDPSKQKF